MSQRNVQIEALVLFSYEKVESDEISLSEGDNIIVLDQQEDGWWLVKKECVIGLFPSTHASIIQVTDSDPMQTNHSNINLLPEGWDSCIDNESGDTYYFNCETGLTQWERPYIPHQHGKKLSELEILPINPSAVVDLLRWKQLREEAEIKIDDLRY